jgi:acetoacetyl-CoA synthetase
MTKFMAVVNKTYNLKLSTYAELWKWSTDQHLECWELLWKFFNFKSSQPYTQICANADKMPGAIWFPGARLNFAENMLRFRDDRVAYYFQADCMVETETWTYRQLYDETARLTASLRRIGLVAGDTVAGFLPNIPAAGYSMLATTSIGAVWSSCSPDFGVQGVQDRFCQIKPKVFITTDAYFFKGKRIDISKKVAEIVASMPSVEKVIVINYTTAKNFRPQLPAGVANAVHYDEFVDHASPVSLVTLALSLTSSLALLLAHSLTSSLALLLALSLTH